MQRARSIAILAIGAALLGGCLGNEDHSPGSGGPLSAPSKRPTPLAAGDDCGGLPVAPDSVRVDLVTPTFSNPTAATNPLFPVGILDRAVLLGREEGEPFRSETTLLPGTRRIVVGGQQLDLLVSQYVAWKDRRIEEVALDLYGQDDDGNVYYFGEDVSNYDDGEVVDHEGTWLAGVDGPPAMIMPASPQVGDVWRPENACPIVFEEVTALQTGVTVPGPSGPVHGALIVRELHMDGTHEEKTFAPGYGEFFTGSGDDVEALAVAVPADFIGGEAPEALDDLSDGAEKMFGLARGGGWRSITALFEEIQESWEEYQATGVPPLVADEMNGAIEAMGEAIDGHDKGAVRQAAVDVLLACLDCELRHDPRAEIDADLALVWGLQLEIDRAAHDDGAVASDLETIRVIRSRH